MFKKIIIFGAGNQAKIIANEILKKNKNKVIYFVDKKLNQNKKKIMGIEVISLEEAKKKQKKFNFGIIGVGDLILRKKIYTNCKKTFPKLKWLTFISGGAKVDPSVQIGEGSFIMRESIINLNAKIGKHCLINTSALIEHDCKLGNFVNCGPRATLLGNVKVGDRTQLGSNCTIIENSKIEKDVVIGASSFVNKDCQNNSLYFGIPAKKIKSF